MRVTHTTAAPTSSTTAVPTNSTPVAPQQLKAVPTLHSSGPGRGAQHCPLLLAEFQKCVRHYCRHQVREGNQSCISVIVYSVEEQRTASPGPQVVRHRNTLIFTAAHRGAHHSPWPPSHCDPSAFAESPKNAAARSAHQVPCGAVACSVR